MSLFVQELEAFEDIHFFGRITKKRLIEETVNKAEVSNFYLPNKLGLVCNVEISITLRVFHWFPTKFFRSFLLLFFGINCLLATPARINPSLASAPYTASQALVTCFTDRSMLCP